MRGVVYRTVLDPTLAVDANCWRKRSGQPTGPEEKILCRQVAEPLDCEDLFGVRAAEEAG